MVIEWIAQRSAAAERVLRNVVYLFEYNGSMKELKQASC